MTKLLQERCTHLTPKAIEDMFKQRYTDDMIISVNDAINSLKLAEKAFNESGLKKNGQHFIDYL